jgi:bacillithiol biosynthesis cysteine-adding enzyme BshC
MSAFSPAFLRAEPSALRFLDDGFRHPSRRVEFVRQARARGVKAEVVSALREQAARRPMTAARAQSLDALASGVPVVVTGQQVGLFLGPLYSLYKAATAVVTARALEGVPVFWLQSEDHDFEEIAHGVVHGKEGALTTLSLASPHVERASMSSVRLGAGVEEALATLRGAIEGWPHADEVSALFSRHYRPEATWVTAFAGVLSELFPSLIILDPRDEVLARVVRPVHERGLTECDVITRVLQQRSDELERAGFDVQVRVRDAALTFVHPDGRDGARFRAEASARLPEDPLCVSSSALLRPIIQDTLLPTAAIVGGPGELNYFAQLAPLYSHFGLPMPMVMPRARFRVVEARPRSLLEKLGLAPEAVEVSREVLLRQLAPRGGHEDVERELLAAIEPVLSRVHGLDDAVERTRKTIARAANRLGSRINRERLTKDDVLAGRVDRLQRALFPNGQPQERVIGAAGFFASFGIEAFVKLIESRIVPFGHDVITLSPEFT